MIINNTPNKKIQHASAFSGSVNFLCGRLGIDASASRRVAQIYKELFYMPKENIFSGKYEPDRDTCTEANESNVARFRTAMLKLDRIHNDDNEKDLTENIMQLYIVLTEDVLRAGDTLIITEIDRLGRTKQDVYIFNPVYVCRYE